MKLLRFGNPGAEKPATLDSNGNIRDLSSVVPDIGGSVLQPQSLAQLKRLNISTLPTVDGSPRIAPCIASVGKFVCMGRNYSDHAAESGMAVPSEPVVFMKATSSICGPNDNVELPKG